MNLSPPPSPIATISGQLVLLVADFLVSIFAEKERHTFWVIGGVYFFQFVFLSLNVVILAIRMTHTYAFKAGRASLLIRGLSFADYRIPNAVGCCVDLLFVIIGVEGDRDCNFIAL
jgi:hypothetical protein